MHTPRYAQIKLALLLALRGERKTRDLSAQLGYAFDQVRRWETAKKQLRWDEFCDYAAVLGVPLKSVLPQLTRGWDADQEPHLFIRHLRDRYPELSLEALAGHLHCHVSALKRYLAGDASPDLEVVFALLDIRKNWLSHFVLALVSENQRTPELTALFSPDYPRALAVVQHPLSCAIEMCVAIEAYRALRVHSDEFVAERVGATPEEVRELIHTMLMAGTLVPDGQGKYQVNYQTINTDGLSPSAMNEMKFFWANRGAIRFSGDEPISRGPVPGIHAYRVVATSAESMRKINEVLMRASDQILAILEADPLPAEDVRVVLLQTFSTADVPAMISERENVPHADHDHQFSSRP